MRLLRAQWPTALLTWLPLETKIQTRAYVRQQVQPMQSQLLRQHLQILVHRSLTGAHVSMCSHQAKALRRPISEAQHAPPQCREHQWHRLTLLVLPRCICRLIRLPRQLPSPVHC